MTTKPTHRLPGLLSVLLVAGFSAPPAWAGTTFIEFLSGIGPLNLKTSGAGVLSTSGGDAVFTGSNTTYLNDGGGQQETSGGIVTVFMEGFQPFQVEPGGLAIVITDGSTTVTATVVDIAPLGYPDVLLSDGQGNLDSVEFYYPAADNNFMTLVYNPSTFMVTLTIQGFGGDTATLSGIFMDDIAPGVSATSSAANFDDITIDGPGIPNYPTVGDPLDPDNPWVDFSLTSSGTGAETDPFHTLAGALAAANPGATISMVPGTDSTETPTVNQSVTLANSDFASGSVSIGVSARRDADLSGGGFVSRAAPVPGR